MSIKILNATSDDLDKIMPIYVSAQRFMVDSGNPNQWAVGHPSREMIEKDINNGNCYLITEDGEIIGVFTFIIGNDPTYSTIKGDWASDTPYGTIHRIASSGRHGGIFDTALEFCLTKIRHIRVDTHADNKPMQKVILSHGFTYRGIIYIADGTPRLAYERL